MRKKKLYEYHDNLTMKMEITLVGTALEGEKFRRSILAINNNLDSVSVTWVKVLKKRNGA
jgi:hypothetical protein